MLFRDTLGSTVNAPSGTIRDEQLRCATVLDQLAKLSKITEDRRGELYRAAAWMLATLCEPPDSEMALAMAATSQSEGFDCQNLTYRNLVAYYHCQITWAEDGGTGPGLLLQAWRELAGRCLGIVRAHLGMVLGTIDERMAEVAASLRQQEAEDEAASLEEIEREAEELGQAAGVDVRATVAHVGRVVAKISKLERSTPVCSCDDSEHNPSNPWCALTTAAAPLRDLVEGLPTLDDAPGFVRAAQSEEDEGRDEDEARAYEPASADDLPGIADKETTCHPWTADRPGRCAVHGSAIGEDGLCDVGRNAGGQHDPNP